MTNWRKGIFKPTSYGGKHQALLQLFGNAPLCIWDSSHIKSRYEWANVTGEYSIDIQDYLPMCVPCHRRFDISEYQRERMRNLMKGKPPPNKRAVGQYKDQQLVAVHDSLTEASESVGVYPSAISNHLVGKSKLTKGYTWRYM